MGYALQSGCAPEWADQPRASFVPGHTHAGLRHEEAGCPRHRALPFWGEGENRRRGVLGSPRTDSRWSGRRRAGNGLSEPAFPPRGPDSRRAGGGGCGQGTAADWGRAGALLSQRARSRHQSPGGDVCLDCPRPWAPPPSEARAGQAARAAEPREWVPSAQGDRPLSWSPRVRGAASVGMRRAPGNRAGFWEGSGGRRVTGEGPDCSGSRRGCRGSWGAQIPRAPF